MWTALARFILKFRLIILILVLGLTIYMAYIANGVQMSYAFNNAIPTSSPKYKEYQKFKEIFGQDGNMMVVGFKKEHFFEENFFNAFKTWSNEIKKTNGIVSLLSVADAMNLKKNNEGDKTLSSYALFENGADSNAVSTFYQLPFYKNLLYNEKNNTFLTAIYLDPQIVNSEKRIVLIKKIQELCDQFSTKTNTELHLSGLPYIRTLYAESVKKEMRFILIISLIFTSLVLILLFRSLITVLYSMLVVIIGVIWSVAILVLIGYKITLLTALIPPLMVVIGLPNCIYFLNKYHAVYNESREKESAIIHMVERMGIVTLFTNITAMIGFGVFYFTDSQVLKEFGLVAGVGILVLFLISLFVLPAVFSYLQAPKARHMKYLDNKYIIQLLGKLEYWSYHHKKTVAVFTLALLLISLLGLFRLKQEGYIVDDLPKKAKLYTDLKFFEKNFTGIMPLEILVDTKKKNKISSISTIQKIDALVHELNQVPEFGRALSYIELLKFAKQAYYDGDPANYAVPNMYDISFIAPYMQMETKNNNASMDKLITSFLDKDKQIARISVNIADVGSQKLPLLIKDLEKKRDEIFPKDKYQVSFTGTSVVFLEGSKFIIQSLRDSILLAFIMIFISMLILFRSWRVVLVSIVVNTVPLVITAGLMGWAGIPLKPSTVLVFSVALGIAIDVTIRFVVNYKQDLPKYNYKIGETIGHTIRETGLSILFTSFILAVGFIVFLFSQFDGTKYLGLLTAFTLLMAMVINLTLLPVLLGWFDRRKKV